MRSTMMTMTMTMMRSSSLFLLLCLLYLLPHGTRSVLYGDEQFGDIKSGRFWAFHSAGVSIVNPESCKVERTFTQDNEGKTLPNTWYDGAYMEIQRKVEDAASATTTADKMKPTEGYVLINSGITTFDGHENLEGGSGEVLIFSTDPKKYETKTDIVVSKVVVGGRPVHSYAVYPRDEVRVLLLLLLAIQRLLAVYVCGHYICVYGGERLCVCVFMLASLPFLGNFHFHLPQSPCTSHTAYILVFPSYFCFLCPFVNINSLFPYTINSSISSNTH